MRYGYEPDETHENMHIHRRERKFRGHKLARAVGRGRKNLRSTTLPLSTYNAQLRKAKG